MVRGLLLLALGFPTFPRKHGIDWGWCGPGGVEEAELEFEWDGRVPRPRPWFPSHATLGKSLP